MIYLQADPEFSRGTVARLMAKPSTNTYELVYVSTDGALGTSTSGCGLNMISNGTLIYVIGKKAATPGTTVCTSADLSDYEECLDATDLSSQTLGACDTLKASFTISSSLVPYTDLPVPSSTEKTIYDGIQLTGPAAVTTLFTLH